VVGGRSGALSDDAAIGFAAASSLPRAACQRHSSTSPARFAVGITAGTTNHSSAITHKVCRVAGRQGAQRQIPATKSTIGTADTALRHSMSMAQSDQKTIIRLR
jgi:hypothetical protein